MLVGTASFAADMPMLPPMPAPPPLEDVGSGWYLRGDIGMTNQSVRKLSSPDYAPLTSLQQTGLTFDSSPLFGVGVGVNYNGWLRFDVTGEYRGKANFKGTDRVAYNIGADLVVGRDDYTASKSEWLFLANAYIDLGTWWCVTPFIGAGVGFSRNTISGFRDNGWTQNRTTGETVNDGYGFAEAASRWNFAWALHAGLAYQASQNLTFELAYRYVNLGDAVTGDQINFFGQPGNNNPVTFKDLTSHDLKFGVRFSLDPQPIRPAFPPPLMSRG